VYQCSPPAPKNTHPIWYHHLRQYSEHGKVTEEGTADDTAPADVKRRKFSRRKIDPSDCSLHACQHYDRMNTPLKQIQLKLWHACVFKHTGRVMKIHLTFSLHITQSNPHNMLCPYKPSCACVSWLLGWF
jgi:hypothetical protein